MLSPRAEDPEEGEIPDLDSSTDHGRLLIDEHDDSATAASADTTSVKAPPGETKTKLEGSEENLPPPKAKWKKKRAPADDSAPSAPSTPSTPSTPTTNGSSKRKRKLTDTTDSITAEKLETRENGSCVRTISSATEAEFIGLAEPGTPICLEGCVFHEDPSGFLVINVTWRGKSFVGTLLDSSRHDWAPPRPSESPTPDADAKSKNRSGKRAGGGPLRRTLGTGSASKARKTSTTARDIASSSPLTVHTDEEASNDSAPKTNPYSVLEPLSPVLLDCPCQHCHKQFHHPVALKYHQTSAHPSAPAAASPCEIGSLNGSFQPVDIRVTPPPPAPATAKFSTPNGKANGDFPKLETPERAASASGYSDISDEGAGTSGAPTLEKAIKPSPPKDQSKTPKEGRTKNGFLSPALNGSLVGLGGVNPIPVIGAHTPTSLPTTPKAPSQVDIASEERNEVADEAECRKAFLAVNPRPEDALMRQFRPAKVGKEAREWFEKEKRGEVPPHPLLFPPLSTADLFSASSSPGLFMPPGPFAYIPPRPPTSLHHAFPPPFHNPMPPHSALFLGRPSSSAGSALSRK